MKRMKKETFDNIPECAIYFLAYGESDSLTEEEVDELTTFITINFPIGYTMDVQWDNYREFDMNPAFGLPCKTYQVDFYTH